MKIMRAVGWANEKQIIRRVTPKLDIIIEMI
jgi:hypothetical protein